MKDIRSSSQILFIRIKITGMARAIDGGMVLVGIITNVGPLNPEKRIGIALVPMLIRFFLWVPRRLNPPLRTVIPNMLFIIVVSMKNYRLYGLI